jgi:folylpolyglutamate synthase/dihydrofolate synthase
MTYDEAVAYLLALGRELAAPRQPAPAGSVRAQKFDLANIQALAAHLGHPERAHPSVHVAGTNGKGSVAAMLESILRFSGRDAGLVTGLYTSPHLERINERIRVAGEPIADADFAAAFARVLAAIEELLAAGPARPGAPGLAAHPTFFECVTAMAFDHFAHTSKPSLHRSQPFGCHSEPATAGQESAFRVSARQPNADSSPDFVGVGMTKMGRGVVGEAVPAARAGVDFAVYEVGMGGRLDATNVVTPEVAVITAIDFDHENYLGHSIEAIAGEKAGIIKPGAWVVSAAGRDEARAVVARRAAEMGARLVDVKADYVATIVGPAAQQGAAGSAPASPPPGCYRVSVRPRHRGHAIEFSLPLAGRHQAENAVAAVAAARLLAERGFPVTDEAIVRGLENVRWPGRLDRVGDAPAVYIDGAHNPAGARALAAFFSEHFAGRRLVVVYGAMRDKAVDEIAGLLFPLAWRVILTEPRQARAVSAASLEWLAREHAPADGVEVVRDPAAALDRAVELAAPDGVVLATGSLYLAGELLRHWHTRRMRSGAAAPAPSVSR